MNSLSFKLVEIHDTDDDDVVGGQDLPYLVTASYEGSYQTAVDMIHADKSLDAFNVQPAQSRCKLPFHIEFCTFDSRAIHTFFGVPRPLSPEQELADRYWRSAYARTVGELRAALADLPDEFPLIHSGYDSDLKGNKIGWVSMSTQASGNGLLRTARITADTPDGRCGLLHSIPVSGSRLRQARGGTSGTPTSNRQST